MSAIRKFMVFGPSDTLQRMSKVVLDNTSPQYTFSSKSQEAAKNVDVMVYEEHQKLMNSSLSVTLIMETSITSVRVDIITTGGRMGFSGSAPSEEATLTDTVTDHIVDFAKRFGLTIQEVSDKASTEAQV